MRRGEVWWAELPEPVKSRPVLILTRNAVINTIGSVVVGLVTRTRRGLPTEVPLGRIEGLPTPSVLNLDNLLTVPKNRLVRQMGSLSAKRIQEVNAALRIALDLND